MYVYPEAAMLVAQLVIVWLAFLMLQCAKAKGDPKFKYKNKYFKDQKFQDNGDKKKAHASDSEDAEKDEYEEVRLRRKRSCICCCCCPRYSCCVGDRLVNFLIYDFLMFALVIGYLAYYVFGLGNLQEEY